MSAYLGGRVELRLGDITTLEVDAIVNAANTSLLGGGGVDAAYRTSLELAAGAGAKSLAFPAISTGIYAYPLEAATRLALGVIRDFLAGSDLPERVVCCCFAPSDLEVYRRLAGEVLGD